MNDLYILVNDQETGPFSVADLRNMLAIGEISPQTLYASPGMPSWQQLANLIPEEGPAPELAPPELPVEASAPVAIEPPSLPTYYNSAGFDLLMAAFNQLSSYEEVNDWDRQAQAEVGKIVLVLQGVEAELRRENLAAQQLLRDSQNQSFWKRTFGNHDAENRAKRVLSDLWNRKQDLLRKAAELQKAIDFTPNTPEQKDALLEELKLQKKRLQSEKKDHAITMTEIRRGARVESANAGRGWLGLYDSSRAACERRHIRYSKEAALRPHEDAKLAIERQLLAIERELVWVQRFE